MAYILSPVTQVSSPEQSALARFRRALRREDQRVLDDVLNAAQEHRTVTEYDLPFEMLLLFVLLAEGKEVLRLRGQINPCSDTAQGFAAQGSALWISPAHTLQDG